MFSKKANTIFAEVIDVYHVINKVDQSFSNPYNKDSELLEHLLYRKCWIDTVQWHYEDIIRDPKYRPCGGVEAKKTN